MNYYESVSVPVKGTTWKDTERKNFAFTAENVTLNFVSGTGPVEVSFNGTDLHAELGGTGQPQFIEFFNLLTSEIWIRGVGDEVLQVFAWAK